MPNNDPGRIASYTAGPLALISLGIAVTIRCIWPDVDKAPAGWQNFGAIMIAAWVLIPPVWFWTEWVFFSKGQDVERLKHTHDLARNIWVALVVVLAALLKINWVKG